MDFSATRGLTLHSHTGVAYRFDPGALCLELLTTGGPGPYRRYEVLHQPADLGAWADRSRLTPTPVLEISEAEVADARRLRDARRRAADRPVRAPHPHLRGRGLPPRLRRRLTPRPPRWCSMEHCGNRHKVRALRARHSEEGCRSSQ
jgi:hypothetical protein